MVVPTLYGLVGAGGFGREVMPLARAQLAPLLSSGEARLVFVVEGEPPVREINRTPLVSMGEFLAYPGERHFNVAIAASEVRARTAAVCEASGAHPFSIISESVAILDDVEIGGGGASSMQIFTRMWHTTA